MISFERFCLRKYVIKEITAITQPLNQAPRNKFFSVLSKEIKSSIGMDTGIKSEISPGRKAETATEG